MGAFIGVFLILAIAIGIFMYLTGSIIFGNSREALIVDASPSSEETNEEPETGG
ncbi:hypothetical protein [Bacillus marinisedimentorum]|uniref:hypothetical protein n=1 Tax=Bacillus marinisedimentorum TaxID=1821260 RepID=UPI000AA5ADED|nr:hypothetical protein [Bacillus marinisedimentorum]